MLEEQTFLNIAFAVFATYFTFAMIQCVFIIASMAVDALEEKRLEMTHQSIQTEWSDEEPEPPNHLD
jgi:hypothetical protein